MLTQTAMRNVSHRQPATPPRRAPVPDAAMQAGTIELMGACMAFAANAEIYGENEPADYLYKVVSGARAQRRGRRVTDVASGYRRLSRPHHRDRFAHAQAFGKCGDDRGAKAAPDPAAQPFCAASAQRVGERRSNWHGGCYVSRGSSK